MATTRRNSTWFRSASLSACLLALAAPAVADDAPAWQGYWAENAAFCTRAGEVGENAPDYYGPDGIFGLEWSCDIRSVTPTGIGQSWAVEMQCLDMGDSYSQSQIFMITHADRLLVIDEYGATHDLVRCAKQPE